MTLRTFIAALAIALVGLVSAPAVTTAAPAAPAPRHACTHTSSGSCIQGGQFCPQASYGRNGWDARGHRYVCKGDHTHPHWMLP